MCKINFYVIRNNFEKIVSNIKKKTNMLLNIKENIVHEL